MLDVFDRFEASYVIEDRGYSTDCWIWTKSRTKRGYGQFSFNGSMRLAHRVSFQIYMYDIPEDKVLDHLCEQLACVNPHHLEPVTQVVNAQRYFSNRHLCKKNLHEMIGDNISRNGKNRTCRECKNKASRDNYQRKKALKND